jgi:hypothetical protein
MLKLKTRLPKKLSALTKIALLDLIATEADPKYKIDMSRWHRTNRDLGVCGVCFAGSVMAQRGGIRANKTVEATHFCRADAAKFFALNYIRNGEVEEAYLTLYPPKDFTAPLPPRLRSLNRGVTGYHIDSEKFKTEMARLIIDLEVAGY